MQDIEKKRESWRKWYHSDPKRANSYRKERKRRLQKWYLEYKLQQKCSKCDFNHPAAIHFHHIDPKTKLGTISRIGTAGTLTKLKQELTKCIPICANCHAILHWEEEGFGKKQSKYDNLKLVKQDKINWPSKEQLEIMIAEKSMKQIAKELGVSDNAVAKRLDKYNLKRPVVGYWSKKWGKNVPHISNKKSCPECGGPANRYAWIHKDGCGMRNTKRVRSKKEC